MAQDLNGRLMTALRALVDVAGDCPARDGALQAIALAEAADGPWLPIDDASRNGDDVLLHFPLEGLSDIHPRIVIGRWRADAASPIGGSWVFQNRAYRGYSDAYQPDRYQPLAPPTAA